MTHDAIVLDSQKGIGKIWAEIAHVCEKNGRRIQTADCWIAATAVYYNIPLVTHNAKDYASVPKLKIISMNKK